jgi:hypothetical protein
MEFMNILAPIAAGAALAPIAANAVRGLVHQLPFANYLAPQKLTDEKSKQDQSSKLLAHVENFQKQLREQLEHAGIDLSDAITLGISPLGQIEVRSPHHQALQIEQTINGNPELKQQFYQTAAMVAAGSVEPREIAAAMQSSNLDQFELTIN